MLLENDTLLLRALEPEDLKYLYKWENDTRLWIHGSTRAPYSKYVLRQYIEEAQQLDIYAARQLRLVIALKAEGDIIGAVDIYDLDAHNRRAGIGILVDVEYQGKGYGAQTLELLEEYCFRFLNLRQTYAFVSVENKKSQQLFESAGYIKAGVLQDWIHTSDGHKDVIILQLINNKSDE